MVNVSNNLDDMIYAYFDNPLITYNSCKLSTRVSIVGLSRK